MTATHVLAHSSSPRGASPRPRSRDSWIPKIDKPTPQLPQLTNQRSTPTFTVTDDSDWFSRTKDARPRRSPPCGRHGTLRRAGCPVPIPLVDPGLDGAGDRPPRGKEALVASGSEACRWGAMKPFSAEYASHANGCCSELEMDLDVPTAPQDRQHVQAPRARSWTRDPECASPSNRIARSLRVSALGEEGHAQRPDLFCGLLGMVPAGGADDDDALTMPTYGASDAEAIPRGGARAREEGQGAFRSCTDGGGPPRGPGDLPSWLPDTGCPVPWRIPKAWGRHVRSPPRSARDALLVQSASTACRQRATDVQRHAKNTIDRRGHDYEDRNAIDRGHIYGVS